MERLAAISVSLTWVKKESMLLGLSGWRTKMSMELRIDESVSLVM